MTTGTAWIPRSPDDCWRELVDVARLPLWVPGLRRARVALAGADGLPAEVHFDFARSRTYSLVYEYDLAGREVRWRPRIGHRDAVRGFARFDAEGAGCRVTYGSERGADRSPAELALDSPDELLAAFTRWMSAAR